MTKNARANKSAYALIITIILVAIIVFNGYKFINNEIGSSAKGGQTTISASELVARPELANVVEGDRAMIDELLASTKIGAEENPQEYHRADWKPGKTRMHVWNKDFTKKWSYRDWSGIYNVANMNNDAKTIVDLYTNEKVNMKKADYDHIIPLKYANDHGASKWSNEKKVLYATSLDVALTVSSHENRAKGAKGPSEYMPNSNRSDYAFTWLLIANTWGLSLDQEDYNVIKSELANVDHANRINVYSTTPYFK